MSLTTEAGSAAGRRYPEITEEELAGPSRWSG